VHRPKPQWLAPPLLTGEMLNGSVPLHELMTASQDASGERGSSLWYVYSLSSPQRGAWLMIVPDDWCYRRDETSR
jgi:hypothetical protein